MRSLCAIAAVLSVAALSLAEERLEAGRLRDRGVVFESPPSAIAGETNSMRNAVGLGDVDGDRFDDLLILSADDGVENPSFALLVYGRPELVGTFNTRSEIPRTAIIDLVTPLGGAPYGALAAAASAGDVDGDGLGDFLLGYPYFVQSATGEWQGAAFLVYGAPNLVGDIAVEDIGRTIRGTVFSLSELGCTGVGREVRRIGDFDGDGRDDVAIGAPFGHEECPERGGKLFVLLDARSLPASVDLAEVGKTIPGFGVAGSLHTRNLSPDGPSYAYFGGQIAAAGDLNGDGFDDFLASETNYYPNSWYLIHGRPNPPARIDLNEIVEGDGLEGVTVFFGTYSEKLKLSRGDTAGVGDLTGDGRDDFLLGLPRNSAGFTGNLNSLVYLIPGSEELPRWVDLNEVPLGMASTVFHAIGFGDAFGSAIAPLGDFNGDGVADFAVGAWRADTSGDPYAGDVFVLSGRKDFPGEVLLEEGFGGLWIQGDGMESNFGLEVEPAGDFNGDGISDLLVTAPSSFSDRDPGRAYLIYGRGPGPGPLRISGVEPAWGPKRGGTPVTLRGSGFQGTPHVLFGGVLASTLRLVSAYEIRVTAPTGRSEGVADVTVEVGGELATSPGGFQYTQDLPSYDLARLGGRGFILQGDAAGQGARAFGSNSAAPFAFGDLDGDGDDELLVESSVPLGWRITIVHGGSELPMSLPAYEPHPRLTAMTEVEEGVGCNVAVLGDVNRDGFKDFAIGKGEGVGFLLFGRAALPSELIPADEVQAGRAVRFERSDFDPAFPGSMLVFAPLGDLTGDGIEDFALSFSRFLGEVVIVPGRADWPVSVDLDAPGEFARARISGSFDGKELESLGDVNGDGLTDLLVESNSSRMFATWYLVYGSRELAGNVSIDALVEAGGAVRLNMVDGSNRFSWVEVSAAGDVNGDGFADLLIGVPGGGEVTTQGITYLIPGGPSLPSEIMVVMRPEQPDGFTRIFGEGGMEEAGNVGTAGDYNDDGLADFLIGGPGFQDFEPGNVFLIFGSRSMPERIDLRSVGGRGLKFDGVNHPGGAGATAGPHGDLNGDGQSDFVFRELATPTAGEIARVYVIYGPFAPKTFVRGEANQDAAVDISDALFLLAYLFLGGERPTCLDALDVDDSGALEITDAVRLLGLLFLGGTDPPPPYPERGKDPTADPLTCLGF